MRYLIVLFLLCSTAVCVSQQKGFTIKGKLPNNSTAEKVYLQNGNIDAEIPLSPNKEFSYKGILEEPSFFFIKTDKSYAWGLWIESGDINIALEEYPIENAAPSAKKLLKITSLSGPAETEKNEWFTQQQNTIAIRFGRLTRAQFQDSMTKYFDPLLEEYILAHPNSKFSAFVSGKAFGEENKQKFLSLVNKDLTKAETRRLKAAQDRENATKIGATIDDFELKDLDGKTISLNKVSSKYILLDFWASWCGPCRIQHPELVKTYNKFHGKGFEIVSVSLDESKADWQKAVKKDKLSWIHVSDLKGWENELATRFFVEAIPFSILIDKDRRIVAKDLHPKMLAEKLDELLKQ